MTIDAAGLPLSISSKTYHPNLGDVVMTTTFADYQDVNGLKLPAKITGKVDDFTTYEIQASKQAIDAPLGDMSAPPDVDEAGRSRRRRTSPLSRSARACGSSPGSRITACSSSSPIT